MAIVYSKIACVLCQVAFDKNRTAKGNAWLEHTESFKGLRDDLGVL